MKDLRFVYMNLYKDYSKSNIVEFDKVSEYLPSSLRFMRWIGFPFSSLPNTFQGKYLVDLQIWHSNIVQLWEDGEGKVLNNLRVLYISFSKLRTFDLWLAPNLEQLTIDNCLDFVELHIPADHHSKLEYLYISYSKLTDPHLRNTPNLKNLTLKGCSDLVELQMPAESLNLECLDLTNSNLKNLHLGNTPNLETLILEGGNDLVEFQMPAESLNLEHLDLSHSKLTNLHLGNTPNLKKLKLSHSKLKTLHLGNTPNLGSLRLKGCNDLVELQMPAESLKLECLDLTDSKLKNLHLGNTPNLESLILKDCNDLVELQMPIENLKLEELNLSHSKLRTLDLGLTPNLKSLNLKNCYHLVEINAPIGYLKKLFFLDLSGCGRFKSFVFDKWSQRAKADSLSELHLIAEPTYVCPLHSDNDSPKFQFSCYYKEDKASSFGNLERLISMGLCACTNLESFSRSICGLQCLTKLTLEGSIPEVPKDLDRLVFLEELTFSSTQIKNLPDSICVLKHLKSLKLNSCLLLEKLPEDIGCLEGLKELNIVGTSITRLPQSIFRLRGLRIVGSTRLIDTYGLLLKRRRTSDYNEIICYI